jgi:spore maturation protein CgeB
MDFALYRNLFVDAPRPYQHELVLVGGHNARRAQFVTPLAELPLELYGKWSKLTRSQPVLRRRVKARGAWGETLLGLYNTTKVVLNITNWDPARYPALNQRVFDVPATGAFLLTDYSPELEEHYRIGEEIACFGSVEELKDKARYYLAHDAGREAISRRGYEKDLTLPTITERMRAVIRQVDAL